VREEGPAIGAKAGLTIEMLNARTRSASKPRIMARTTRYWAGAARGDGLADAGKEFQM